jgi:hypothetical protein
MPRTCVGLFSSRQKAKAVSTTSKIDAVDTYLLLTGGSLAIFIESHHDNSCPVLLD